MSNAEIAYNEFSELAKQATELQQMAAIQNAQETPDCKETGSEAEQANFWNVARYTLQFMLDE